MYNYGSEFLEQHLEDYNPGAFSQGQDYLKAAVRGGHLLSLYNLALINFDGLGNYYSCNDAMKLIRITTERTKWSKLLNKGFRSFVNENNLHATMHYLDAAFLGYEVAQVNAAFILDQKKPFDDSNGLLDYTMLDRLVYADPIYNSLFESSAIFRDHLKGKSPSEVVFEEHLHILRNVKATTPLAFLRDNFLSPQKIEDSIDWDIAFKLYNDAANNSDASSLLRLGDHYYYGDDKAEMNIHKALHFYNLTARTASSSGNTQFISQALFNIGYIYHYGIGNITRNLTLAEEYYHKAISTDDALRFTVNPLLTMIKLNKLSLFGGDFSFVQVASEIGTNFVKSHRTTLKILLTLFLGTVFVVLFGLKTYYGNLEDNRRQAVTTF